MGEAAMANVDSARDSARRAEQAMDSWVDYFVAKCGGAWCNYLVDKRQFEEYPASTLLCARIAKIVLYVSVVMLLITLTVSTFMEGTITTIEEVDQKEMLAIPNMAVCALPWGGGHTTSLTPTVGVVQVPDNGGSKPASVEKLKCSSVSSMLSSCECFGFKGLSFKPHGKRGKLDYFEYVRFQFKTPKNTTSNQFAFSFYESHIPQQWNYAAYGDETEGDVRSEEVAEGKTEFTDGTPISRFSFRHSGQGPSTDGSTVLVFGYDKFVTYVLATYSSRWNVFTVVTIVIAFCAAINNLGLFEIMFPEKLDEEDPAQLEPNHCCQYFCSCFACCNPHGAALKDEEV